MKIRLECKCIIDDALKSTVHYPIEGSKEVRSKGDVNRYKHHYPLHAPPESYCLSCDRYRPCSCDVQAHA